MKLKIGTSYLEHFHLLVEAKGKRNNIALQHKKSYPAIQGQVVGKPPLTHKPDLQ